MLESSTERKCKQFADACNIKNVKLFCPWDRGYPDRLFLPEGGVPFFVEFKRTKNSNLRAQQRKHRNELLDLNYIVYVCHSLADFKEVLMDYDNSKENMVSVLLSKTGGRGPSQQ